MVFIAFLLTSHRCAPPGFSKFTGNDHIRWVFFTPNIDARIPASPISFVSDSSSPFSGALVCLKVLCGDVIVPDSCMLLAGLPIIPLNDGASGFPFLHYSSWFRVMKTSFFLFIFVSKRFSGCGTATHQVFDLSQSEYCRMKPSAFMMLTTAFDFLF